MAYNREEVINYAPGGDSVKSGIEKLDTDLTGAFTHLNTIDTDLTNHAADTSTHGVGSIVGVGEAQTLTNKTLTTPTITLKQSAAPTPTAEGDIQWDTDGDFIVVGNGTGQTSIPSASSTHTLTNKTISLASNTVSGTLEQFNTAVSDADLASLAGSETLINKTLTTPVINGFTGDTSVINIGSGQIYKTASGNLLVGTTAGFGKFRCNTGTNQNLAVRNNSQLSLTATNDADSAFVPLWLESSVTCINPTSGNLLIGTTTDDGTNKLQVSGSVYFAGNVGIGIIPTAKLHIAGNLLRIESLVAGAGALIQGIDPHATAKTWRIGHINDVSALQFSVDSVNSHMALTSTGNLLIGTTTDDGVNKLQVSGGIAFTPSTTTTAPAAGGAGALPATPLGYATITINGTARKIAYYA